jgi:hypothetical protein
LKTIDLFSYRDDLASLDYKLLYFIELDNDDIRSILVSDLANTKTENNINTLDNQNDESKLRSISIHVNHLIIYVCDKLTTKINTYSMQIFKLS